jgi:hypothetical protein
MWVGLTHTSRSRSQPQSNAIVSNQYNRYFC